jgi:flagellar basal body L-ring protein FlgH
MSLTLWTLCLTGHLLVSTLEDVPTPVVSDLPPAAGSLWDDRAGSLYDDFKARRVGDLVTIVVVESTTASARANTTVQKSESASTTAGRRSPAELPLARTGRVGQDRLEHAGQHCARRHTADAHHRAGGGNLPERRAAHRGQAHA